MKAIFKYPLNITGGRVQPMPAGAIIRHVAYQEAFDAICLWAEVDDRQPAVNRVFYVYGTGHLMPDDPGVYIGTALTSRGEYVFHVYEHTDR